MGPRLSQARHSGLSFAVLFLCLKLLERELTFEKLGVYSVTPYIYIYILLRERESARVR